MPEFPKTNYDLIESVKDSENGEAWAEFVETYEDVLLELCRRRGLQDADARDVAQQVFASTAKAIAGWKPDSQGPPFRAWLTTVARNAIFKCLSRVPKDRASGTTSVADLLAQQPADSESTQEFFQASRQQIIRRAAEQIRGEFTASTWEVFRLTALEGVPVAEVAARTSRSTGSVYVIRHRIIARLKERIGELSAFWGLD